MAPTISCKKCCPEKLLHGEEEGGGEGGGVHKQHKIMERPLKPKQGTVLQVFLQQVVAPLRMRESDRFKHLSIRDPSCSNT